MQRTVNPRRRVVLCLAGITTLGTSLLPSLPGVSVWSRSPALAVAPATDGSVGTDDNLLVAEVRYDRVRDDEPRCQWSEFTGIDPLSGTRHELPTSRMTKGRIENLYERLCGTTMTHHWIPRDTPNRIVEKASDRATDLIPRLLVRTAPPIDRQVVRIGTWFWVPRTVWRPVSVTAHIATSVGPLIVTLTATPTHLVWSPGDGNDAVVCEGPGRPWRRALGDDATSECMYTYLVPSHVRDDGEFASKVSVQWALTYSSNFGLKGRLSPVRFGLTHRSRVLELQALSR